jgi:hypothetical protein
LGPKKLLGAVIRVTLTVGRWTMMVLEGSSGLSSTPTGMTGLQRMPTNSGQLAFNVVETFPLKLVDVNESLMGGFYRGRGWR